MAIVSSPEQYIQLQKKRIAEFKKIKPRTPVMAARYMAAQARSMCPRDSGNMLNSIRVVKNVVTVRGLNKKTGWPYVHWINETPGMSLRKNRIILTSWGKKYSQIKNRTGVPGFFWIAEDKARVYFRNATLRATRSALKAGF